MFTFKNDSKLLRYVIVQIILLIALTNAEVHICIPLGLQDDPNSSVDTENISTLLEKVANEFSLTITKSKLSSAQSFNYTYFHVFISHSAVTLEGDLTDGLVIIENQTVTRFATLISEGFEIFNLTVPSIYVNGSYDLSGYAGAHRLFDVYGKGDFYLQLTNLSVAAVAGLKINGSSVCIPVAVNLYLKDFKSEFTNLMNGDVDLNPLINGAIQAIVPDAVRIIFREDADSVDPYIQRIIDDILNLFGLESMPGLKKLFKNTSVRESSEKSVELF